MTTHTANTSTGHRDSLGVDILIGDTVTISGWGDSVRLCDAGRTATVTGTNRAGNLVLATDGFDGDRNPIANGRGVRPGYVLVARRDGARGHQGNVR